MTEFAKGHNACIIRIGRRRWGLKDDMAVQDPHNGRRNEVDVVLNGEVATGTRVLERSI